MASDLIDPPQITAEPSQDSKMKRKRLRKMADEDTPAQSENVEPNVVAATSVIDEKMEANQEQPLGTPIIEVPLWTEPEPNKVQDQSEVPPENEDSQKEEDLLPESIASEPEVELENEVEDINITKALRHRSKCKNRLIGEIEDTTMFADLQEPVAEEEQLRDQPLDIDNKTRKKKSLGDFLSKITGPQKEQEQKPNVEQKQEEPPKLIEISCAETFTEVKVPEVEEKVEELEIVPSVAKEPQPMQDRNTLLVKLAEASKKRRSKNMTLGMLKEMVQCTELTGNKSSSKTQNEEEDLDSDYDPDAQSDEEKSVDEEAKVEEKEKWMEKIKETRRLIRLEEGEECSLDGDEDAPEAQNKEPQSPAAEEKKIQDPAQETLVNGTPGGVMEPENDVLDKLDEEEFVEEEASEEDENASYVDMEPELEGGSNNEKSEPIVSMEPGSATQHGILDTMIVERKKLFKESELAQEKKPAPTVPIKDVQHTELRKYFETEAELGSDNELNDDIRKEINKNDKEENEEGLDKELAEIIDKQYQATGEEKETLMRRYFNEELKSDKAQIQKIILGEFAHKRKRDEAGVDDLSKEYADRRMKRMMERENQIKEREQEVYDIIVHGTNKAQNKLMEELEKEDLSEGEMELALELNKQQEMRKALYSRGSSSLFEKNSDLQQFSAMIEKKNRFSQPTEKTGKKMSQAEAVKLAAKTSSLMAAVAKTQPINGPSTQSLLGGVLPKTSEKSSALGTYSLNQFVKRTKKDAFQVPTKKKYAPI